MSTRIYAIGLDVGGTKIAGGVVDLATGRVIIRDVIPTLAQRGGAAVLDDCVALAQRLQSQATAAGFSLAGMGVGVCELVDPAGRVTDAYNFDWRDLPVRERFSSIAPTVIEADVRAAALAEARYGAGRPYQLFVYVTVGTGISYCLMQEGRPLVGARGNALAFASAPLTTTCPRCGIMIHDILETFAGGPGLVRRYNQLALAPVHSGQAVLAAATAGDEQAIAVVTSAGAALGNSVAFLCNVLDPEAVIVGGGLGLASGRYWESFVQATREHIYAANTRTLPILQAALDVDAGIVGAAAASQSRD
ncbi:MAG: ROK family protein [Caldilineaceae bacterium]